WAAPAVPRFACNRESGLFCLVQRGIEAEELLDSSDEQGVADAIVYAYQRKRAAVFVMGDIGAHEGADPRGVDVGHTGEIYDQGDSVLGPQRGLEVKERAEHNRTLQAQNALPRTWSAKILDRQGVLRSECHLKILASRG